MISTPSVSSLSHEIKNQTEENNLIESEEDSNKTIDGFKQKPILCRGHTRPIVDLKYSEANEDGIFLFSASKDGIPMLRDGITGDWIGSFQGHTGAICGVDISKDATIGVTASADFTAKIWNMCDGTLFTTFSHPHVVKCVSLNGEHNHVVTGCNDKKIRVFSIESQKELQVVGEHDSFIRRCVYSKKDENILFTTGEDKLLKVWDVRSNKECQQLQLEHDTFHTINFTKDENYFFIAQKNSILNYTFPQLELNDRIQCETDIYCCSIHPNETTLVCGGIDSLIYKYNYLTQELLEKNTYHTGRINVIQYSPDGKIFSSGSDDGNLCLWQSNVGETYGLWKRVDI
ncbi:hypothetical protein SNEBB_000069 [Seison nebaliae]|nr:hypothetical protein SNEBB_000069 [Seison nebaliae]